MKRPQEGFTLIEIILVLAIAGLILVSVFLAVSGAQRARRDHQRKDDLARMVGAVEAYAANNNGQVPLTQAQADVVYNNYLTNMKDPLTGAYTFTFRPIGSSHGSVPPVATIYYQQAHWCSNDPGVVPDNPGDPITGDDTATTKFAVWTQLEAGTTGGGGNVTACYDNK